MKGEGKRPLLRPGAGRGRGESWKGGTERFPPCPRLSPLRASLGGRRLTARSAGTSLRGRGEAGSEGGAAAAGLGSERGFFCSARRLQGREPRSPPVSLSLAALSAFRPPPARPGPASRSRPRAGRLPYPQGPAASGALFGARSAPGCSPELGGAVPGLGKAAARRRGCVPFGT